MDIDSSCQGWRRRGRESARQGWPGLVRGLLSAAGLILAIGTLSPAHAETDGERSQPGEDVMFGHQDVGFGIDRDVVRVGSDVGKFDRIRLRVLDNDIYIVSLSVTYVDGGTETLDVGAEVAAGSRSDWLDIDGDRFIKDLVLVYRSKPNFNGQARVEVLGEYAAGWLGPGGEGRRYNNGWVLLGSQTAGIFGYDKDVIEVGKNEGGFSQLRVTVKDKSITLREIRVKYYSGKDDVFRMRDRVDPGRTAGPFTLSAGRAAIKAIEARYRSRLFFAKGKGRAVVEIWGKH